MSIENLENGSAIILSLKASNIKKLTAIQIDPKGNVITLKGKNGNGKSSVLDAIVFALGGTRAVCEQPIRQGASKAEVICELSNDLVVTRNFTGTGTTLRVTTKAGAPIKSPQAILDALVGNLAFDPLEFARMDARKQLETLRKLVGIDFTQMDADRATLYAERTQVNRDIDKITLQLESATSYEGLPDEEISVAALMAELEAAEAVNEANNGVRLSRSMARETMEGYARKLDDARAALDKAILDLESAEKAYGAVTEKVKALVDIDIAPIKEKINSAGETNKKIQAAEVARKAALEGLTLRNKAAALTEKIVEIDDAKKRLMAEAKFPIPELGFDDAGVTYQDVPFSQASMGEKTKAGVGIGMALNPKLRVMFIRDASLLDEDNLQLIADMAVEKGYQIWMEDARSTNKAAIVIEDGHIKLEEKE